MPRHANSTSFKKGFTPWNKGRKGTFQHTEEYKKKMSQIMNNPVLKERIREKCKKSIDNHFQEVLKLKKEFEEQGFRFIPFVKVIPDAIIIKNNQIFAVELEFSNPNYNKYFPEIKQFYDDIIWIIKKRGE